MNLGSFGQNILQGFVGVNGLRDYTHASKTFRSNNYELTPRTKFLFHCYFNINTGQIPALAKAFANNDVASIGHLGNWRRHFVNVVTETFYEINRNHFVTEKLYKPIIGCRPFLIYDPDGGIKWLAAAGFENYTQDFKDISDLNPAEPAQLPHFLKTLSEQSVSYWKKKFIDLSDKILYNKTHFDEYVRQQKSIVAKGISCQI